MYNTSFIHVECGITISQVKYPNLRYGISISLVLHYDIRYKYQLIISNYNFPRSLKYRS